MRTEIKVQLAQLHDQRLLLSEGTLRGSPRLMGIAGAFVGVQRAPRVSPATPPPPR